MGSFLPMAQNFQRSMGQAGVGPGPNGGFVPPQKQMGGWGSVQRRPKPEKAQGDGNMTRLPQMLQMGSTPPINTFAGNADANAFGTTQRAAAGGFTPPPPPPQMSTPDQFGGNLAGSIGGFGQMPGGNVVKAAPPPQPQAPAPQAPAPMGGADQMNRFNPQRGGWGRVFGMR